MYSRLLAEQARQLGVSQSTLESNPAVRKECVDVAFGSLLKRLKQEDTSGKPPKPLGRKPKADFEEDDYVVEDTVVKLSKRVGKKFKADSEEDEYDEEEDEVEVQRYAEDDGDSDDLGDFSGLEELDLEGEEEDGGNEKFPKRTLLKPATRQPKRKVGETRLQRGFHKLAGLFVCVLSTGETGYILKRMGGRLSIKLKSEPQPVASTADRLFTLSQQPTLITDQIDKDQMLNEIYEACKYVPQLEDLKIGQRIALPKLDNATGRVSKIPDAKKVTDGMGHVTVILDKGKEERKVTLELLRIVDEDHVTIAQSSWGAERTKTGRPTKAEMARKPAPVPIIALIPHSKRGDAWRRSLECIHFPDKIACASLESDNESRQVLSLRSRKQEDGPKGRRAQKPCTACGASIAIASKTCGNCGTACVFRPKPIKPKL
ncbi:hypothetical protein BASA81_003046 [Batrachochytrium salamandrivorans]|nr:hypothetical protein BASA81_003046 [Batrachochytrium salamandrivorans]